MHLVRPFVEHPAAVGESYFRHLRAAAGFGAAMIGGGMACLVHALLPFAYVTRGSETIARLHERMIANRVARRLDVSADEQAAARDRLGGR
ncbi:MAG: hypothetical protein KBG29_12230 [Pseudomonadales bacterium]|nr:hypothetical protein [Pseudomonadales bacterium]